MTDHIRHSIGSVRPYLHGQKELVGFLEEVFDATQLERHEFGPESFHVELQVGDSVIALEAGELPDDISPWRTLSMSMSRMSIRFSPRQCTAT